MILKIFLFLLISISSTNAATVRITGAGNLATSLDPAACSAYAGSIGATDMGEANWGVGKATGCSHWTGQNKVFYNTNEAGADCAANMPCIEVDLGPDPDFYEEFDPEPNPIDQPVWNTKDTACGPNKFVTIGDTGELECGDCSGSNDPAAFLVEFSSKRDSGTGVKHGKCCINSHHHVCQQLLNSYKTQCTDDDGDKGHLTARTCEA
tara:strand:+ start:1096 stop:1719 length:624 start_codon:yes stop_codon:yes gene_type:complete